MANVLQVFMQQGIVELHAHGMSSRKIAAAYGIDRKTVLRYLKLAAARKGQNGPPLATGISSSGQDGVARQNGPPLAAGDEAQSAPPLAIGNEVQNAPSLAAGAPPSPARDMNYGRARNTPSLCEGYRKFIEGRIEQGLTAVRIYQDLKAETGYHGAYNSVKRFVRKLKRDESDAFRRMEVAPGEEMQVDFGVGAPVEVGDGKVKKPWLFRMVLSHSRKAYSEVVWRQDTESFIRAMENAFRYFGGTPKTVVTDNLKAAVEKADWHDPTLNPKLESFAEHYNFAILPCRPRTPRHKGKVERCVGYAQSNALRGRKFSSLAEENAHLLRWEENVADMRIHGTTRKQVKELFESERPHLGALPPTVFPCFEEAVRRVHPDGHVSVANAYYSVPGGYVGHDVRVRWDLRMVRVCSMQGRQIAVHARVKDGGFSTNPAHISERKISSLERGDGYWAERASRIGPSAKAWARRILKERNVAGMRVVQGLVSLAGSHKAVEIDRACADALRFDAFRLREVKELLRRAPRMEQPPLPFVQEHKLIRPIAEYAAFVKNSQPLGAP